MTAESWVLLHSSPLTAAVWDEVRPLLGGASVYCPESIPPTHNTGSLVDRLRADLVDVPEPLHLVGHSFGGQVAIDLATAMPGRVSRITLLCSRDTPFPAFSATAARLRNGVRPVPGGTLARWFRPGELAVGGPMVDYARDRLERSDLDSWATALESIACYEHPTALSNLGIPVSLIACEYDAVSSAATMSEMADRIPGATFRLLTGAALMSPFLHPRALAGLLRG
jgi:3-oxoadipate enol-lactonase